MVEVDVQTKVKRNATSAAEFVIIPFGGSLIISDLLAARWTWWMMTVVVLRRRIELGTVALGFWGNNSRINIGKGNRLEKPFVGHQQKLSEVPRRRSSEE